MKRDIMAHTLIPLIVGSDCENLWLGYAYCVQGPVGTATSGGTAPSAPTQSGIASDCHEYYTVASGDSCQKLEAQYDVTLTKLYAWNSSVRWTDDLRWTTVVRPPTIHRLISRVVVLHNANIRHLHPADISLRNTLNRLVNILLRAHSRILFGRNPRFTDQLDPTLFRGVRGRRCWSVAGDREKGFVVHLYTELIAR